MLEKQFCNYVRKCVLTKTYLLQVSFIHVRKTQLWRNKEKVNIIYFNTTMINLNDSCCDFYFYFWSSSAYYINKFPLEQLPPDTYFKRFLYLFVTHIIFLFYFSCTAPDVYAALVNTMITLIQVLRSLRTIARKLKSRVTIFPWQRTRKNHYY